MADNSDGCPDETESLCMCAENEVSKVLDQELISKLLVYKYIRVSKTFFRLISSIDNRDNKKIYV